MTSVGLPIRTANTVVALAAVPGSRSVDMLVTQILLIHGLRALRLAKVGCAETDFCAMHCGGYRVESNCLTDHYVEYSDRV